MLCVCVFSGLRMRVAGCVCTSMCPMCRAGPAIVCVVVALLLGNVFLGNGHWGGQWAGCVDGFVPMSGVAYVYMVSEEQPLVCPCAVSVYPCLCTV